MKRMPIQTARLASGVSYALNIDALRYLYQRQKQAYAPQLCSLNSSEMDVSRQLFGATIDTMVLKVVRAPLPRTLPVR